MHAIFVFRENRSVPHDVLGELVGGDHHFVCSLCERRGIHRHGVPECKSSSADVQHHHGHHEVRKAGLSSVVKRLCNGFVLCIRLQKMYDVLYTWRVTDCY